MLASQFRGRIAALFGRRPSVEVRPLEPSSAELCYGLHRQCFAHAWSPTEFETLTASSANLADGAYIEGTSKLVGFVVSRIVAGEAEILTIAVEPRLRGQGLGRQLLQAHMAALVSKKVGAVFLEVEDTNAAALALYARTGFEQIGRREGYYRQGRDRPAAALTMRKLLS